VTTLEIRRHSLRKDTGGSQLSQEGVDLARKLGESMGPFAVVATSVVPRARETALAMGFAVDQEVVTLSSDEEGLHAESAESQWWLAEHPFAALAALIGRGGASYRYAHAIAAVWRDLLTPLPADQAALVIGHSGDLEYGLVACFPHADHTRWGRPFDCCEGARLTYSNRFCDVEFLRSP
jgi:broad specificity phosphatase PhoE